MGACSLRALTWNLYHGRDRPPDPALYTLALPPAAADASETPPTCRSTATCYPSSRDLLAAAEWDVALLQECPPRWATPLAAADRRRGHRALTSRNSLAALRDLLARLNPDLIASNEGGSNLTLVRGEILDRRELVLEPGPAPERRVMAFTRARPAAFGAEVCVANLHASAGAALRAARRARGAARRSHGARLGGRNAAGPRRRPQPPPGREPPSSSASRASSASPRRPRRTRSTTCSSPGSRPPSRPTAWPPERREVATADGAIRLSDHAPVTAAFRLRPPLTHGPNFPPGGAGMK